MQKRGDFRIEVLDMPSNIYRLGWYLDMDYGDTKVAFALNNAHNI